MADRLHLLPKHRRALEALLQKHLPDVEVWAYGSRVNGRSHDGSDLDLVLRGPDLNEVPSGQLGEFEEAVRESTIPFLVEARDWARLPERFHQEIERHHVVLAENSAERATVHRDEKHSDGSEWHESYLGDLLSFANGKSSPARSDTSSHPVYGSNGVIGFSNRTNADLNTIVIGRVGTYCGSLHYSDRMCWVTDNAIQANAISSNDSRFLFYLLQTLRLNDRRAGSGQPLLNQTILSAIPVVVPDPTEQRAIAHILGTLDDKIELNRRMNETLEAMAQALFKSWFVEFDPVRAKMEGRDTGLPRALAALFPNEFVDSPIGEIPEEWPLKTLEDVMDINPPRRLREAEVAPYLDMANMPTNGHTPVNWTERPFGSGARFVNGDALLARITPCLENGKTAYVDFLEAGQVGWGSTEYIVLRPKSPLPSEFGYFLARSRGFREFAIQSMTGSSGRQRVPVQALSQYKLPLPPKAVAESFGHFVRPLVRRAGDAVRETRVLSALRDTLLPKLISGEVRVNHVAKETA